MSRQLVSRAIVAIAAVLLAACSPGATKPLERPRQEGSVRGPNRPNVLIIVTDDQRGGLAVMPRTRRAFWRGGVRFSSAFVTTPVCCPSRASILSGRYAHNHGVKSNRWRGGASNFDPRGALPRLLRDDGYRTGLVGQYLNTWPLDRPPHDFDDYFMTKGTEYRGGRWNKNGHIVQPRGYSTSVMSRAASAFVREQAGSRPWFLLVGTIAPHSPFVAEEKYRHADVRRLSRGPAHRGGLSPGKPRYMRNRRATFLEGNRIRAAQLRTLMSVDDLVGDVLDVLDETGQSRDTLAFFISDNGTMWGELGLINKGLPYTPAVKVPMMMRWPARVTGGTVDRRFVANIDIAPTIIDAVGAESSTRFDGRSLLDSQWHRDRLLLEYWRNIHKRRPWAAVRTKKWQYTEHYDKDSGAVIFRELYDLERDPSQWINLLWGRDAPARAPVKSLERALSRDRRCAGTSGPRSCP